MLAVAANVLAKIRGDSNFPGGRAQLNFLAGPVDPIRKTVGKIRKKSSQMKCQLLYEEPT